MTLRCLRRSRKAMEDDDRAVTPAVSDADHRSNHALPATSTFSVAHARRSLAVTAELLLDAQGEAVGEVCPLEAVVNAMVPDGGEPSGTRAEGVGFEPTVGCPTHAFQACRFGRSRIPPGTPDPSRRHEPAAVGAVAPRTGQAIVYAARDRRWRPGPVQLQPVNRVRAGRQQLSAEPVVCRRQPGRHLRSRAFRVPPSRPGPGAPAGSIAAMAAYQSLYRRYRSQRFDEVLGQDHVTKALRNAVRDGRVGHAYLFSGPRGTGKTSTARILAKVLNCAAPEDGEPCGKCESCVAVAEGRVTDWLLEQDAASKSKVDDMRDLLERVPLGTSGNRKVIILDEVHMLCQGAENALLEDARGAALPRRVRAGDHRPAEGAAHHPQPHPALRVPAAAARPAGRPRAPHHRRRRAARGRRHRRGGRAGRPQRRRIGPRHPLGARPGGRAGRGDRRDRAGRRRGRRPVRGRRGSGPRRRRRRHGRRAATPARSART